MILVVCNGSVFQQTITQCLNHHGFLYDAVSGYHAASSLLSAQHYSLIIVESRANATCVSRVHAIVKNNPDCWVMVLEGDDLSLNDRQANEADYFDVGVDDYLCSPFNERTFVARIRSRIRRSTPPIDTSALHYEGEECIEVGPLQVDQRYHSVVINGQTLTLTAREFTLLDYFCRHPDQVFSRNELLSAVWGYNHEGYEHTVNTHINRLRAKLDKVSSLENAGQLVQTVWGVGYKLNLSGYSAKALSA